MDTTTTYIPQPLKIVAWLFIASGILAVINVIGAFLFANRFVIDLNIFAIFIGRGLLNCNIRSLKWARLLALLGVFIMPIFALLFFFNPGMITISNVIIGQAPIGLGFILYIALFLLNCWEYKVLRNEQLDWLFSKNIQP